MSLAAWRRPDRLPPVLLLLTGSTCSGKSAIGRLLTDVPNLEVHDVDAVVAEDADAVCRQQGLESWVQQAVAAEDRGVDVLLTTQSPLGEALAVPTAALMGRISVCLIDVSDEERLRRLAERDPGVWSAKDKDAFLARADWHRHHAADPTYRRDVLTSNAWAPMMWDRWAGWGPDDPRWRVEIIDTTGLTVAESADRVRAWIETVRNPPRDG